jgi:pimeloyl-ACP methyl ester carboxylesterase
MGPAQIESIEVGGRRLVWRVAGAGRPLLLVNGYAASGADWDPGFLAALSEEFEILCPDNAGIGKSDPAPGRLTIDAIAEDLRAVLEARDAAACAVVGWSMGGFAAQRLAEVAPRLVGSLALLATDPGGVDAVAPDREAWRRLVDHGGSPREQASRLISLLFPPAEAATIDRELGEVVAEARAALSPSALRAQEEAMEAWHRDTRPGPAEPPPTLILHGREDQVIPSGNAELLADRWRSQSVELLDGCGHALMAQRPAIVASTLREFFAG